MHLSKAEPEEQHILYTEKIYRKQHSHDTSVIMTKHEQDNGQIWGHHDKRSCKVVPENITYMSQNVL